MFYLIKRLWIELTRVRKIEFISFETEEEENSRLSAEFESRKLEIMQENEQRIIKKMAQFEVDTCLYQKNYLMGWEQALALATAKFIKAKCDGKFDELNSLKEGV